MVLRHLKKLLLGDHITQLEQKVGSAFYHVRNDIDFLKQWVSHLHEKGQALESSHHDQTRDTSKDIKDIRGWLHYLYNHSTELHKYMQETTRYMQELERKNLELTDKLEKIEQGQLRTLERTTEDIRRDMSLKKDKSGHEDADNMGSTQTPAINQGEFTGSQREVLNLLYYSDRPLTYEEISSHVYKKEKSIRNLMYELRKKGVNVETKAVGDRRFGFFVGKGEKIRISGR
ncbi:MAG: hypothetical protein ABH879_09545 [archaeon]